MINKFFSYLLFFVLVGFLDLYAGKRFIQGGKPVYRNRENIHHKKRDRARNSNPPLSISCCEVASVTIFGTLGLICGVCLSNDTASIEQKVAADKTVNDATRLPATLGVAGAAVGEVVYATFFKKKKKID